MSHSDYCPIEHMKKRARSWSHGELSKGNITKPTQCEWCKNICYKTGKKVNKKLQMHHEDYNIPEWITWLCGSCHSRYHKKSILGPRDMLYSWEWRKSKEYNPQFYHLFSKPNKETLKAFKETDEGKNLIRFKNFDDMMKNLQLI